MANRRQQDVGIRDMKFIASCGLTQALIADPGAPLGLEEQQHCACREDFSLNGGTLFFNTWDSDNVYNWQCSCRYKP